MKHVMHSFFWNFQCICKLTLSLNEINLFKLKSNIQLFAFSLLNMVQRQCIDNVKLS